MANTNNHAGKGETSWNSNSIFPSVGAGNILRDLIESRGLYSKDIAAEINVSTPTLSRYLQGVREPELKYVVRLARYFGVSVDWLLGLSNDRYEALPAEVREFATLYALASPDDRTIVETVLKKYREEN